MLIIFCFVSTVLPMIVTVFFTAYSTDVCYGGKYRGDYWNFYPNDDIECRIDE